MKKNMLPLIITKRLILRPLLKSDAEAIYEYARLKNVGQSAGWNAHTSIHDTHLFIDYAMNKRSQDQPGVWVICEKGFNYALGTIEIHSFASYKGEIGFVLHPSYWNKGYITEAARAVMIHAFEHLRIKRLQYAYFLDNDASKRVCEKLNFAYEGIKRSGFLHENGQVLDEVIASYTSDDYFEHYSIQFEPYKKDIRFLFD